MSYARFTPDSDVYVYCDVSGYLCCCGCSFHRSKHYSTDAMLSHLRDHVAAGHDVPDYTFDGLERDREENDAFIAESGP